MANYGSSQQKAQEKALQAHVRAAPHAATRPCSVTGCRSFLTLQAAVSVFEDVGGLPDAQATFRTVGRVALGFMGVVMLP